MAVLRYLPALCLLAASTTRASQQVLLPETDLLPQKAPGRLHGKFLHITDFHPDRFYKAHASTAADSACHRGEGAAGYYGAETSDCDSPVSLINATFDWLDAHVKNDIDFVLWTGDSARHDNDEEHPRTTRQIRDLNRLLVQKFEEVFGRDRDDDDPFDDFIVPVVPNLGNNDVLPHNIFNIGPNEWTRSYLDIWKNLIPEEERHEFDQNGWFTVDVIPGYLTVFSLNTLYFFGKNAAVDGCSLKSEPGYRQMEWLRNQLQFLRQRGMKAMLIGHVPPARTEGKRNWDETCWQKYALWMRQYRDVIVGSFYGHMNIDHFMLQDFDDIDPELDEGYGIESLHGKQEFGVTGASSYVAELRAKWGQIPKAPKEMLPLEENALVAGKKKDDKKDKKEKKAQKKAKKYLEAIGGEYAERFSLSFVSPSVVPNYYPTFRIVEYNVTGVDYRPPTMNVEGPVEEDYDLETQASKKKQRKKRRFTVPLPPTPGSPPGPAYSPQSLSMLGYQQYYANLTVINNDFNEQLAEQGPGADAEKWNGGKHKTTPKGDKDTNRFRFELLYDTRNDSIWALEDLTVRSYVELAQRISAGVAGGKAVSEGGELEADKTKKEKEKKKKTEKAKNQSWGAFVWRAFVGTQTESEIWDEYGDRAA